MLDGLFVYIIIQHTFSVLRLKPGLQVPSFCTPSQTLKKKKNLWTWTRAETTLPRVPHFHSSTIYSPSGFFEMLFGDSSPFPEQLGLGPEASVGPCVGDPGPRHQDSQPSLLPRGGRACPAGRRGSRTLSRLPFPRSLRPARPGPDLRAPASSFSSVTAATGLDSPTRRFSSQFEKPSKEAGKNVAMKAENRCRRRPPPAPNAMSLGPCRARSAPTAAAAEAPVDAAELPQRRRLRLRHGQEQRLQQLLRLFGQQQRATAAPLRVSGAGRRV